MPRVRRGSGVREHDLLARAKALRESVDPLLPRRTRDCPPEKFDRLRADLEAVREDRDDEKRLGRATHWGEPLVRSYAGLLKFYLDPKTPGVVSFPLPDGEVSYAPLARAPRETEVAVQQSDEPARLLLGYVDWARKGFHFFATRKALWCAGKSATPPDEFRAERVADLPYRLIEDPAKHLYLCPHLKENQPRPFLEVALARGGDGVPRLPSLREGGPAPPLEPLGRRRGARPERGVPGRGGVERPLPGRTGVRPRAPPRAPPDDPKAVRARTSFRRAAPGRVRRRTAPPYRRDPPTDVRGRGRVLRQ